MSWGNISFVWKSFSARLAAYLDEITCDATEKSVTYVVQTGSWDFQFFPVRGFVNSNYQGRAVVDAIDRLLRRTQACAHKIEVIYMSTMPHPWCKGNQKHCLRLMNYYRNNGAIRAANQFMETSLRALNHSNLRIFDTSAIIMPRFPLSEYTCVDHFLCNEPPKGMEITPAGVALANEILLWACKDQASDPDSTFRDGHLYVQEGSDSVSGTREYFTVQQGCRRQMCRQA